MKRPSSIKKRYEKNKMACANTFFRIKRTLSLPKILAPDFILNIFSR